MMSAQDTRQKAAWDHILWCAEQAAAVWRAYRPADTRPQQLIDHCRERGLGVVDDDDRCSLFEALDAAHAAAADAARAEMPAHMRLAIEYAVNAITMAAGSGPIGSVMRDVRVFAAHARSHHAAQRALSLPPAEVMRVETDTLELVRAEQDNDLLRRLRERGTTA